jgi:SAM-dependent methyltransferase
MRQRVRLDILEGLAASGISGFHSPASFDLRFHDFVKNIDLAGKRVLDIGCGAAVYCVVAEAHGAAEVIGLEPAVEGSRPGVLFDIDRVLSSSKAKSVTVLQKRFQDFSDAEGFDLILSLSSINHLDERSCKDLQVSETARAEYRQLFYKVYEMLNPGGTFVISDAGRRNLFAPFARRGWFRNPFVPMINWTIHQEPEFWCGMLLDEGFVDCKWSSAPIRPLKALPRLARSRLLSLATNSKFVLHAYKDRDAAVNAKWTSAPISCVADR